MDERTPGLYELCESTPLRTRTFSRGAHASYFIDCHARVLPCSELLHASSRVPTGELVLIGCVSSLSQVEFLTGAPADVGGESVLLDMLLDVY